MMTSSLPSFLRLARETVFQKKGVNRPFTVVLGNTSADLDSFISAVVFAYFHTNRSSRNDSRFYVPVLNLADVPSSDLWRLRPEYGTALRLALHGGATSSTTAAAAAASSSDESAAQQQLQEKQKKFLEYLITVADIRNSDPNSALHAVFAEGSKGDVETGSGNDNDDSKQDVVLVDHNAPQVTGLSSEELSSRFNPTGVIDHHVEENVVSSTASPRIVTTGIGSCCSLVVKHLRDAQLWADPSSSSTDAAPTSTSPSTDTAEPILARLALAPILIDTANLQATGDKVSATDHAAVAFLESQITPSDPAWDREAFYTAIQQAKSDKLRLLTMTEIFESDYKEWTEKSASSTSSSSQSISIGIASLVQDLRWLLGHAGSGEKLVTAMLDFARTGGRDLRIVVLITKGNAPGTGAFRKELAVLAFGDVAGKALERFERDAGELDLKEWKGEEEEGGGGSGSGEPLLRALEEMSRKFDDGNDRGGGKGEGKMAWRVWWQGDVSKSRKQVAPLMREAVQKA